MKTTYRGTTEALINGEMIPLDVISKRGGDTLDRKGWRRIIIADLLSSIQAMGNQKFKVLEYLIDKMDGKNQINTTYDEIMKDTGIARPTIAATFKILQEANFLKKHKGVYVINCSIISAYGKSEKNGYLMIEYGFNDTSIIKDKKDTKESQKDKEIKQLREEIELLKSMIPQVA